MNEAPAPELFATAGNPGQLPTCEHCKGPFERREGSGGRPQRFCSPACRRAFHANSSNVPTSPPTSPSMDAVIGQVVAKYTGRGEPPEDPDWKWWGENRETIVLEEQPKTAVYWNQNDAVVIRQERSNDDEDTIVIVTKGNLRALINRLIEMDSQR
jgi:hypothetical protein